MPRNHFKENRQKVHSAFIAHDFLKPIVRTELPLEFVEKLHRRGDGKLRIVRIDNVPSTDAIRPISYVLELELSGELFSLPPGFKTVEKAILLLTNNCIYVVLVEMKSTLDPTTIRHIEGKIKDSIGRVSLFLTHYIFDQKEFDDYRLKFFAVTFYNNDRLTEELSVDPTLENSDVVQIFRGAKNQAIFTEPLGDAIKVKVFFKQNTKKSEEFNIDFKEFFSGDPNYENAVLSDKTLP